MLQKAKMTNNNIASLEERLDYVFKDNGLLINSLMHSSYVNEKSSEQLDSNERLEFLGDSVLGMLIAEILYKRLPSYGEGALTAMKSRLVNTDALSDIARNLGIGDCLILGKGAEKQGESNNNTLLEDAFEAVIGAIYLDGGYECSKKVIEKIYEDRIIEQINLFENCESYYDYKTALQIKLQKNGSVDIKYEVISETGPDHEKIFTVAVRCGGKKLGEGMGKSKKMAEQMAAKIALEGSECI